MQNELLKQNCSNIMHDLTIKSYSKINLGLWVKEKRIDGYHEIETIFLENESLYDDIEIRFEVNNKSDISVFFLQEELNQKVLNTENLAYKATSKFLNKINFCGNCIIKINKRIPLEAGLGGGSSNAAYVLKGLNQMFNHPLSLDELLDLALQIGSDVPFFIYGKACLAKGRGEILTPLNNALNFSVKIVKPDKISISTKWAYDQIDAREFFTDHNDEILNLITAMQTGDLELLLKNTFNDFEMIAFSYHPELIIERNKLFSDGYRCVRLCGSGAALFGIQ